MLVELHLRAASGLASLGLGPTALLAPYFISTLPLTIAVPAMGHAIATWHGPAGTRGLVSAGPQRCNGILAP